MTVVLSGLEVVRKLFVKNFKGNYIFTKPSLPSVGTFSICFGWLYICVCVCISGWSYFHLTIAVFDCETYVLWLKTFFFFFGRQLIPNISDNWKNLSVKKKVATKTKNRHLEGARNTELQRRDPWALIKEEGRTFLLDCEFGTRTWNSAIEIGIPVSFNWEIRNVILRKLKR